MAKKGYAVGFGKPPKKHQFKPGQSGNPKGRPSGVKNLATDLEEELSEKLLVTEGGKQQAVTKQRAMLKALVAKALKGDVRAAGTLLNLIPSVEEAQKAATETVSLSKADQEVLDAFRQKLAKELTSELKESSK